jgi:hypothetical protein
MPRQNTVVTEFEDRYGDTRIIHRNKKGELKVARQGTTVAHSFMAVIAVEVGKRIRERRIAAGMTLEQLCVRAGLSAAVPKTRMWEIENAIRQQGVKLGTLYAIAQALGCPIQKLLPTVEEAAETAGIELETSAPRLTVAR